MDFIINLFFSTLLQVWTSLQHNWPFLLVSILVAVALKLFIDPNKVSAFLIRYRKAGVIGATAAAVATPLCSCGTTAIILGMMAGMMPWAPIVAFMVASPLTSPEELVYSAGLFGWPFAWTFFLSSILLGLLGGLVAGWMENHGWLANQARMATVVVGQPVRRASKDTDAKRAERVYRALSLSSADNMACGCGAPAMEMAISSTSACGCGSEVAAPAASTCGCSGQAVEPVLSTCGCGSEAAAPVPATCGCGGPADATIPTTGDYDPAVSSASACSSGACASTTASAKAPVTLRLFLTEVYSTGKRLLVMFLGFAFIGYFLNGLIPQAWVAAVFGSGNVYSIPLAATLGLPLYINTEGSLPLVRALIDGGMSQGAALAFLITGAGTSFGAIAGALTIARWRVIGLVIGTLWVGAVAMGYLYNVLLAAGWV